MAAGPAVQRALQRGYLTVVVDEPESGLFSEQNRSIAQGSAVAASEINAAGGLTTHVHVRLLTQRLDGLSQPAVRAKLSSEGAGVLVLPCDTESQERLSASTSQWGMLMLAPCSSDSTAGARYPTYWPVGMTTTEEDAGLVTYMKTVGYGTVFVVGTPGDRYVETLAGAFRRAAQADGIQVLGGASIAPSAANVSTLISAIKGINPPPAAVYTPLPPPLVDRVAAALVAGGLPQTIIGGSATDTQMTLSSGSKTLENVTFASYGFPRESASAHRFESAYARRFGRAPVGSFPALGFETIRLLEAAARKAGSGEPSAIEHALLGGITLHGVGLADRVYEPNGNHDPVGEVAIAKVSGKSFVPLLATTPKLTQ